MSYEIISVMLLHKRGEWRVRVASSPSWWRRLWGAKATTRACYGPGAQWNWCSNKKPVREPIRSIIIHHFAVTYPFQS